MGQPGWVKGGLGLHLPQHPSPFQNPGVLELCDAGLEPCLECALSVSPLMMGGWHHHCLRSPSAGWMNSSGASWVYLSLTASVVWGSSFYLCAI